MEVLCSICSDLLFGDDHVTSTLCCHVFHERCITSWCLKSKTCPDCRAGCEIKDVRRMFFNSETKDILVSKLKEEIIDLKQESSRQTKEYKHHLNAEMEIRKTMHEKNKFLEAKLAKVLKVAKKLIQVTDTQDTETSPPASTLLGWSVHETNGTNSVPTLAAATSATTETIKKSSSGGPSSYEPLLKRAKVDSVQQISLI